MSLANLHTLTLTQYKTVAQGLIRQLESSGRLIVSPYFDTAKPAKITIGDGFNIDDAKVRNLVLDAMNITGAQRTSFLTGYSADRMQEIRNMSNGPAKDSALAAYLNGLLPGRGFTMTTDEVNAAFVSVSNEIERLTGLNSLLATPSYEKAALLSLGYNTPALIGAGVRRAIALSNPFDARAELWYQIRYSHANQLHKRRYVEAAVIGLYGENVPAEDQLNEAAAIYRMYAKHSREATSSSTDLITYDQNFNLERRQAQLELNATGLSNITVSSLRNELQSAANTIIQKYITEAGINDAPAFDPLNIQVISFGQAFLNGEDTPARTTSNADLLIGSDRGDLIYGFAGNDVLYGLAGDDYLEGGAGDDTLVGGDGDDIYVINLKDGPQHDRIIDSDHRGRILIIDQNGNALNTINLSRNSAGTNLWASADGKVNISHNSPWKIALDDGTVIELGEGFEPAGFGINLTDPSDQSTSTYIGDFKKKTDASGHHYEFNGENYKADGQEIGAADQITGSDGADIIRGLGGDDALLGRAGDDLVEGGDGSDVLQGGLGADTLNGGNGDDVIYGSSSGSLENPADTDFDPPVIAYPHLIGSGFNWKYLGDGLDSDGMERRYLSNTVGRDYQEDDEGNTIDAGAGNDQVAAGTGNDVVHGRDGNDVIDGMGGADALFGDEGNDRISGDATVVIESDLVVYAPGVKHGKDLLDGGAGNDTLLGQGNDDQLFGGTGDDVLWGDDRISSNTPHQFDGDDYLDGGEGKDLMIGGGRSDTLIGGDGDDSLFGDDTDLVRLPAEFHGNDVLDGGAGDDQLTGGGGSDLLLGGTGNDTLLGDIEGQQVVGDDTLDGGEGDDLLQGGFGQDSLEGGAGNDMLNGQDGSDTLRGAEGNDSLWGDQAGQMGNDLLDGGAGSDFLDGGAGEDILDGGDSTDRLDGGDSNDTLIGGAGADDLRGGNGDDTYVIAAADSGDGISADTITDTSGTDVLQFEGVSADAIQVTRGPDGTVALMFSSTQGINIMSGITSSITTVVADGVSMSYEGLLGSRLVTTVNASSDNAGGRLVGGSKGDTLVVNHGSTSISGGQGADSISLNSGKGAVVSMLVGDGTDLVTAAVREAPAISGDPAPQNVLQLGAGFNSADIRLFKVGAQSYVLSLNALGDGIRFDASADQSGSMTVGTQPFDVVRLDDGTLVSWQQILNGGVTVLPSATGGNDTLILSPVGDVMNALGGNDYVDGLAGNDILYGGAGNDTLIGGLGDDALFSNEGIDSLVGGEGNDTLTGGDRSSQSTMEGGEGDDHYYFRFGYDTDVRGTASDTSFTSNDTYHIGSAVSVGGTDNQKWTIADNGGLDALKFETQLVTTANTKVRSTGTGFILTSSNLTVELLNAVSANGGAGAGGIESVTFQNGTVWTMSQLRSMALQSTSGNDTIVGFGSDDVIDGGNGSDSLYGGAGNDQVAGGAGFDYLWGGAGNDTLDAGAGGGAMIGDEGDDTYIVHAGDGNVVISDSQRGDSQSQGHDVLQIAANPSAVTVNFVRGSADGATRDSIMVNLNDGSASASFNLFGTQAGNSDAVEEIRFLDGSSIDVNQFVSSKLTVPTSGNDTLEMTSLDDVVQAGDGNDTVSGRDGNDTLYGGAGIDYLKGGLGDDVLDGGAGNDTLEVGYGYDTVIFDRGYGQDNLTSPYTAPNTTIRFGSSIAKGDVQVRWMSGAYLSGQDGTNPVANGTLALSVGPDRITVSVSRVSVTATPLNAVTFSDGTSWGLQDLSTMANTPTSGNDVLVDGFGVELLQGGDGNDTIFGLNGSNTLEGGAGDDVLEGGDDNDRFVGGAGNDLLRGHVGMNTVVYGRGDGNDTVTDASYGLAAVEFTSGISQDDISIVRQGLKFIVQVSGSGSIAFDGIQYAGEVPRTIRFADGTIWDQPQILNKFFGGTIGNDLIEGFGENDSIFGGTGNDVLIGMDGSDTLDGGAGDDTLYAYSTESGGFATSVDVLVGGSGNDRLFGGNGVNNYRFDRGFGHDIIDRTSVGSNAQSNVIFGAGILPTEVVCSYHAVQGYVLSIPSTGDAVELDLAANDQVRFADGTVWTKSDVIARLVDNASTEASDLINGTAGADVINALGGDDVINGRDGADSIRGMSGNDSIDGGDGNDTIAGGVGDDTIQDGLGDDRYEYQAGDGHDIIEDFGGANDVLVFGSGITSASAQVKWDPTNAVNGVYEIDFAGSTDRVSIFGIDSVVFQDGTVWTSDDLALQARTLRGTAGNDVLNGTTYADRIYGLAGNDQLNGQAGADWLDGGVGADTMKGSTGDDTYVVDDGGDVVTESSNQGNDKVLSSITYTLAANVEMLELTGNAAIGGTGNTLANVITGNSAANVISGGTGNDTMIGGAGDDTYVVDSASDVVTEAAGEGIDLVQASATYTLGNNVENLTLTGSSAISGTGNTLDNVLTGNSGANTLTGAAGNDTLDGGLGNDTMVGGTGNDTYVVNVATDVVTENASEGTDTVLSAATLTLANNVENLVLTGTTALSGTGNTLANTLTGNAANNTLNGGTGNDTLIGGAGDDIYVVDAAGDVVTENAGEGIDLVQSGATYTLAANVENLTLTGTSVISGTGNTLDNVLTGNGVANTLTGGVGNDTLDGGVGTDTLVGGIGNDVYLLDVAADVVTEAAGEGTDTVQIGVAYTLGSNVENLTLTGSSAIGGTGNTLDNLLTGNGANNTLTGAAGNDTLDGGLGNDTMVGGTGNDTYVLNVATDVITENAGEGTDTVLAAVTYTLGTNLENLTLTGGTAFNGTGNALANALTGNVGANTLTGAAGADTLDGGLGVDTLIGGADADTYIFGAGYGVDTIQENDATAGVKDGVSFGTGITSADIQFLHVGNDLNAVLKNTSDKLVIKDWYLGNQYRVEEFRFTDGTVLTDIQAQALVGAMAAFNPPAASAQDTVLHNRLRSEAIVYATAAQ